MESKKELTKEEFKEELLRKIEEDPQCFEWFSRYNKSTWNNFISTYSMFKSSALVHPDYYLQLSKPLVTEFNNYAQEILKHIQYKKLFNLQCEWRAERVKLPGVEFSEDFEVLKDHVMECPLIPPVSHEEMELYLDFLHSPVAELYEDEESCWQSYFHIKEFRTEREEQPPAWIAWYDEHYGTGFLINLPDIRGKKENRYSEVYFEHQWQQHPLPPSPPPDPESQKPFMHSWSYDLVTDFAMRFETEELAQIMVAQARQHQHENDYEEIEEFYEYLQRMPQPLALVPHTDWRTGIVETVLKFKRERSAKALPRIWRQYRQKYGDYLEANREQLMRDFRMDYEALGANHIRNTLARHVLEGRVLLGEPADFNF